jgi:drug/metabolite transporter (DMT)-like permease
MPRWLLWSFVALLSWGVWAILSKLIGDALSAAHSQALSTIGLVPVILALGFSRRLSTTGHQLRGTLCALAAGVLGCAGNIAYYHALNRGGKAATVVALAALYPLVTILLAVALLKEKLNRIQIAGVLTSLAAIYLFNVYSAQGLFSSGLTYALVPIAFWGVAGFLQKASTNHLSGELSTLWFLLAFIPVAGLILWRESLPPPLAPRVWLLVTMMGVFLALGNFALLAACAREGKASIVVPLTALYPVVSVPIAILFLGERIGPRETVGIFLALASVAALSYERPAGLRTTTVQRFDKSTS